MADMPRADDAPKKGRPRLTPALFEARVQAYCRRYDAVLEVDGLPPFPSGKRESAQHRAWLALYKTRDRLIRRSQGRCERCPEPVVPGSIFCEAHRTAGAANAKPAAAGGKAQRKPRDGRCSICLTAIDASDVGPHRRCRQLATLAAAVGPTVFDRVRRYVWPDTPAEDP